MNEVIVPNELTEKYAIMMAGCNVDIWTKYYSESAKNFWRERAEELVDEVLKDWSNASVHV